MKYIALGKNWNGKDISITTGENELDALQKFLDKEDRQPEILLTEKEFKKAHDRVVKCMGEIYR